MKKQESLNNIFIISSSGNKSEIVLKDNINFSNSKKFEILIQADNEIYKSEEISLNLDSVLKYDSYLVLLIRNIRKICNENNINFNIICRKQEILDFINIYEVKGKIGSTEKPTRSFFKAYVSNIGNFWLIVLNDLKLFVEYLGDLFLKLFLIIIKPFDVRWKDFPLHLTNSGVNALPIVLLILFLIGLISGYQGAIQLQQFGADIFIADLIGISITRELGPLMTAIIIAGRSGSSFTAEIGTMKVSEEIDSLKTMGFDLTNFLVLPRVLAVTFAMPFLTILANVAGIIGGLVSGLAVLNITISGYLNQLQRVLGIDDIISGLIKSMVFGFLVASVGCFRGLQVKGGAESVGKNTTISVVNGILLIILSDALLTFLFETLGL